MSQLDCVLGYKWLAWHLCSHCFSQLRWLWRREISRDERREKLRIPFGICRKKKSKKYPNVEKIKQSLTNSMIMKNTFIAQRFDSTKQSFQIVVFLFETHLITSFALWSICAALLSSAVCETLYSHRHQLIPSCSQYSRGNNALLDCHFSPCPDRHD